MKNFFKKILIIIRKAKFKKHKNLIRDITLLSNCCVAGTMYHDLNLPFLSPTINLYFGHHSFIDFVINLKEYCDKGILIDSFKTENTNGAPIGILKASGLPDIEIHFLHYKSFTEAKQKWEQRIKRINFSKIFLVIEAKDKHEHALLDEYASLPYRKIIYSNLPSDETKSVLNLKFYNKKTKKNLTSFSNIFGKKYYDNFDFVNEIFKSSFYR